jgi:hypothetical protein
MFYCSLFVILGLSLGICLHFEALAKKCLLSLLILLFFKISEKPNHAEVSLRDPFGAEQISFRNFSG